MTSFNQSSDQNGNKTPDSKIPNLPIDSLISEERANRFKQVLAKRSDQVRVVIENCHDPHNATAIIRSCDAFGVDTIHIVTNKNTFKVNNSVSKGTHHYVEIKVHKTIEDAYATLRKEGFEIYASDLASEKIHNTLELTELYEQKKIALVFGEESLGLTQQASQNADGHFLIPMTGFTQSLNVSVALAVTLYAIRQKDLCQNKSGNLTQQEQTSRYTKWVKRKRGIAVDRLLSEYKGEPMELEIIKANIINSPE